MGKAIHETEVPKTTLNGFEPVRAFTFRSVNQCGTTEPAIATDQTTKNLCNLYDTLLNVINHVASSDFKGIYWFNLEIV